MISEDKKKVLELFAKGRDFYKLQQFSKALEMFQKALEIDPEDGPSQTYVERCQHYLEDPPPPNWDGVYVMKTK
jgi:tetratricopeptide (TPR) repeat protein